MVCPEGGAKTSCCGCLPDVDLLLHENGFLRLCAHRHPIRVSRPKPLVAAAPAPAQAQAPALALAPPRHWLPPRVPRPGRIGHVVESARTPGSDSTHGNEAVPQVLASSITACWHKSDGLTWLTEAQFARQGMRRPKCVSLESGTNNQVWVGVGARTAAVALPGAAPMATTARSAAGAVLPSLDCIHVGRSRCSSPSSCGAEMSWCDQRSAEVLPDGDRIEGKPHPHEQSSWFCFISQGTTNWKPISCTGLK